MTSSLSLYFLVLLGASCLLEVRLVSAGGEDGPGITSDNTDGRLSGGRLVQLLKMSLREVYQRNAGVLLRELERNLAVVSSALRGDMWPVKRDPGTGSTGTTSLGSGALYFLARDLQKDETTRTIENAERNERLFDIAGK